MGVHRSMRATFVLWISLAFGAGDSFRAELFYRLALFGGKIRVSVRGTGE
jgi:hypothetical protein